MSGNHKGRALEISRQDQNLRSGWYYTFRDMGTWSSTKTQQTRHTPRFGPKRSSAKDGAPERLRYRI